jgi:hypothetical protein
MEIGRNIYSHPFRHFAFDTNVPLSSPKHQSRSSAAVRKLDLIISIGHGLIYRRGIGHVDANRDFINYMG